jgi:hypothetical protein
MSDTTANDRDSKTGRFLPGNAGNGGRKPGQRNKLGEAFIEDLRDAWNEMGAQALRQCAEQEPGTFCKIIASLLPKTIDLNIAVDATAFADRFRMASELLGNEPSPRLRKLLPGQPGIIEHDNGS